MDSLSLWLIAGLILMICEMLSGGFFLIFIALGCFGAGLASSFGVSMWVESLVCAVIAVVGVIALRRPIQARMLKSIRIEADIGKEIRVDAAIAPQHKARITYQGTPWSATNIGAQAIELGDHVVIVGIDGNILLIRKVDQGVL